MYHLDEKKGFFVLAKDFLFWHRPGDPTPAHGCAKWFYGILALQTESHKDILDENYVFAI